ncbi:MAG: SDR family oxidoreductase [Rubrobacteraceae bacterium]
MKVLVAGANGQTARQLVRMLVENGHEVRGLIRKEDQMQNVESDGAEPVLADLEQDNADGKIGEVVVGCDAVIFAAGAGPGSGNERKETMDRDGAIKLIEAAEKHGARRYLMLSTMGADDPESRDEKMQPYMRAKGEADARLRNSTLDYTIIRPGRLTDDAGTGTIVAAESLGQYGEITREDVARAFAATLEAENTHGKTIEILSGDTSIEETIESV